MSLKTAAKYIESQGRGKDSRLMHVSPRELKGLQDLAMAKGGSLSINPNTGLPEAGFLEDVLPIAAAGALMYFAPGVGPAIGSGLGLGTGALGTGVGMGLLAGGASAATQLLSTGNVDLGQTLKSGLIGGASGAAMQGLMGGAAPTSDVSTLTPAAATYVPSGGDPYMPAPASYIPSGGDPYMAAPPAPPANSVGAPNSNLNQYGSFANFTEAKPSSGTLLGQTPVDAKTGLSGNQMLATGLGGVAALSLLGNANQSKIQTPPSTSYIRPYSYSQTRNPLWGQPGQPYYVQKMTAQPTYQAAEGGLMSNGVVERMSEANAGEGTYPGAFLDYSTYATPSQMPTSAEVVRSDYEVNTDPYNGTLKRMAEGGDASIPTSQAVQDYNKLLSSRAAEEYLNNPMLAAFRPASTQPQVIAPPVETPQTYAPGAAGLYEYYLGRKPAENELAQWNTIDPNAMATPESDAYFNQYTAGELGRSGYKPKGPDPFLTPQVAPQGTPFTGLPTYSYNPVTRSYTTTPSMQAPMSLAPPPMDLSLNNRPMMGGEGKAGGLMPYNLGGYSDGGRLLKGPGDGMSDNIPASIGNKQPARLADGEFVIPADVVSHLGNGSTDAGAKKLYAMMDKVRNARTGNKSQGKQIKAEKYLKT